MQHASTSLRPLNSIVLGKSEECKAVVEEGVDGLIKKFRGVSGKSSTERLRHDDEPRCTCSSQSPLRDKANALG
ncbi:MAG: hypothetical protein QXH86_08470 [Ignisphaera sp.]